MVVVVVVLAVVVVVVSWTSKCGVLLTFWLRNVLRRFFKISTSKSASCHNNVQFFISHLPRWLRTRRFSEPTLSTLRSPKSLEKHKASRLFYLFVRLHLLSSESFSYLFALLHPLSSDSFSSLIFSLLLFSSLTLPTSAFLPSMLSEVWLLNFLR